MTKKANNPQKSQSKDSKDKSVNTATGTANSSVPPVVDQKESPPADPPEIKQKDTDEMESYFKTYPAEDKSVNTATGTANSSVPPVVDQKESPPADPPEIKQKDTDEMESYFKTYPSEREFLRTSDGQVFLSKDRQWADLHQKSINPEGKVKTIKRD